jgi:general stress protein 26
VTTKTIDGWEIEYDKYTTQASYAGLPDDIGCTCHTCRNFIKAAPSLPKAVFAFFEELGIDLLKPSEIYENQYKDGRVMYGGFYHIVGNYLSGADVWQPVAKNHSHQNIVPMFHVADDFDIGFAHSVVVVPEGFPRPVLQMEVNFSLPWVLEEPYESECNYEKERKSINKYIKRLLNKKIAFAGSEASGRPYIKAMLVSRREGGSVFYFDSNNGSARAAQWSKNPNACVYFYGRPIYRGVMLSGKMEIINDIETKKQYWKRTMKSIYKGGVTDPDYCILKFTADSGRYYSMFKSEDFEI